MTLNPPEKTLGAQLLEFLTVLMKYRRGFVRFVVLATLATLVVTLILPKWYKSTASVFPAEKAEMISGLEGVSSLVKSFSAGRALSSLTGNDEADRYMAILKSSTVIVAVIERFNLVELYDYADSKYKMDKTAKELL
ncbi:MAG: lipopolysaccharide biosynthesis protein, partial [Bacteroidetes bacterium]|nr:lipopolysaccharide biosynthesis protein [Bacteroidota bacterium]